MSGSSSSSHSDTTTYDTTFTNAFAPGGAGGQTAVNVADSAGAKINVTQTDHGAVQAARDVAIEALDTHAESFSDLLETDKRNYGNLLNTTESAIRRVLDAGHASQVASNQRFAELASFAQHANESEGAKAQEKNMKLMLGLGGLTALVLIMRGK